MKSFAAVKLMMVLLFTTVLAATASGQTSPQPVSKAPNQNTNRIAGGAPSPGRPFAAALLFEDTQAGALKQYCGATVIADKWLLTAAHCHAQKGDWAFVNRSDLNVVGGIVGRIDTSVPHPQYKENNEIPLDNDIALIKLAVSIPKEIPRVTLMPPPPAGTKVTIIGWGPTSMGGPSSVQLLQVEVPVVANSTCKQSYPNLTLNMLCAGEPGKDPCQGDSGGPMFVMSGKTVQQFGIVSRGGVDCGHVGVPAVYSRVDRDNGWIRTTLGSR